MQTGFELPDYLGASTVPLHGPENTLEIEMEGRLRKVILYDPHNERGSEIDRFKRVWKAVVRLSPIKAPL